MILDHWQETFGYTPLSPATGAAGVPGLWVAVFNHNDPDHTQLQLAVSTNNGFSWTLSQQTGAYELEVKPFRGVAVGEGRWVAVGNMPYTSTNPILGWQRIDPSEEQLHSNRPHYDIKFANGAFIVPSAYNIYRSTNGLNWNIVHSHAGGVLIHARLAHGNGTWVMGGIHMDGANAEALHRSTDNGLDWSVQAPPPEFGGAIHDIGFGGGQFVAVGGHTFGSGDSVIGRSVDGVNWTMDTTSLPQNYRPTAVGYANGTWIIGSGNPNLAHRLYVSSDGVSWQALNTSYGPAGIGPVNRIHCLPYRGVLED